MKVNSIEFLVFFPAVAIAFYILPHRWRWVLLLAASYLFFASWNLKYLIVLLAVTAIGYLGGLWLAKDISLAARRIILIFSLFACLGVLFFFKYFEISSLALHAVSERLGIQSLQSINIILPLGISFFTFQTISYILDVYRGVVQPEKHAGIYSLFVAFFPHLTAGPIARANLLLPQFRARHTPDYENIVSGLQRMVWGFFKKLVIADRLAVLVDAVYGDPTAYSGIALIVATYAFAFQIYCDFSGYADIAIGAARVMGFKLQENFQQPYYAQSIPDFWRRWHITLYNWLRDYVYYPIRRALHGSKIDSISYLHIALPLMATMLASGLWHGTHWNFLVWGTLHGIYMTCSVLWARRKIHLSLPFSLPAQVVRGLRIFATFNLVCFAWIFFRAHSLSEAFYIVQHLFVNHEVQSSIFDIITGAWYEWMIALLAVLLMEIVHGVQMRNGSPRWVIRGQPIWLRWSIYFGLVMAIFMFGKFAMTEFIYSRF